MSGQVFVRIQSPDVSARGIHVGVFGLVNMLGRDGLLSPEDEAYRVAKNRWFDTAYTDPSTVDPTVYDRAVNPLAVAWFKKHAAAQFIAAMSRHCDILARHDVAWERVESDDPGRVVYEDEFQVVVVPRPAQVILGRRSGDAG